MQGRHQTDNPPFFERLPAAQGRNGPSKESSRYAMSNDTVAMRHNDVRSRHRRA